MNTANPDSRSLVRWWWPLGDSAALVAAAGFGTLWLTFPEVLVLWALLLVALVLTWLGRTPVDVRRRAASTLPLRDPVDVALRTRLATAQAELEALRGVQRELLAAKVAAEAGMLAKSEFLASMSHEIRTPLNGVLPLLDIVLGTDLSPNQREYLVTANASARELLRIVDDILDYSKAEAGKLTLESVSINIRDLVDNVNRLLAKPAEAKGLAMRAVVDADVRPLVRGDPVRIRQILTNLVSNAIKFTQRGGVSLRVSRRNETATHHELLFAVRDTGIGLAAETAARLFQPFTQADASVTRRYGGTGLGLTICKKLVDMMGGRIGVRSEPGRGSVFWFTIPFDKVATEMANPRGQLVGARTLLVAGPQRAQAILPVLATLELETTQTATTAEALHQIHQVASLGAGFRYDLLLVDAASADGDAAGLLHSIGCDRQLESLRLLALGLGTPPHPRVVVVSAHSDDAGLRHGVRTAFGLAPPAGNQPILQVAATPAAAPDGAEPTLVGRVLLVEDHPVNQKVARKLLERLGLAVECAGDGEAALQMLRKQPYAMVLMDCQMPVLDGYTATRRLREIESAGQKPHTPVIAMTAHAMSGDRERCLEAGMDDYLSKPLERKLLAQTLAHWLEKANASGAALAGMDAGPPVTPTTSLEANAPAMPNPPEPDALDTTVLVDLEEIMGDELAALVDAYLRDGDVRMRDLRRAADDGDSTEIGRLAHSLKSSSANLGAMRLAECARQAEMAARSGTLTTPSESVAALERLYSSVAAALRARYQRP